jgi:CheY-like chemotaxis protein/rubrerythrin
MTEAERVIQLLREIETETAAFYDALARRAGEPPELRALWLSLAEDERQHAAWVRRLEGSRLAEGVLASLAPLPVVLLEAALDEIRQQRERIEHGGGSSRDALAAAIALETSEASRALTDLVAAIPHDQDRGPFLPGSDSHLGRLELAAKRLGLVELAAAARDLVPRWEPAPASRRRILIVDDDLDMVDTCARILRLSGHHCLTATSGRAALALLQSHRPDLILADLRMPEMDGLALLTHARRVAPRVPVVIFTGYGSTETARQAREAGAAAYLEKPFGVGELRDVVARMLSASPARASESQ